MKRNLRIRPPFFEIGPKNYLYGDQIIDLARLADEASQKYDVRVIFTTPYANIARVSECTKQLIVFAPHMDNIEVGRGLAAVLPESLRAAGAQGVMLNHVEKPMRIAELYGTIRRARELGMMSIVCADSIPETKAVALLEPDMMVTEPAELIATACAADVSYVRTSVDTIMNIDPNIGILVGGGINSGQDVYNVIAAGADATGSSSAIATARNPRAMIEEMLSAARGAWNERCGGVMMEG